MAPRTSGSSKQNPIEPTIPGGGTPTEGVVAPSGQEPANLEPAGEPVEEKNPDAGGVAPPDQENAPAGSAKAPPPPPGFRQAPNPKKRR
jgi:hypothetical protein